jgi:aspartyl protease family protein
MAMIRAALLFVVCVGIVASFLTAIEKPSVSEAAAPNGVIMVNDAEERTAALSPPAAAPSADGAMTLQRQMDGHFYADAEINGTTIHMLVDTGATAIALTRDDARKAGIGISIGMPNVVGQGAGGEVKGEFVTVDRIRLGGKTGEAMNAVVLDGGGMSLLGQTFLGKFASVEIHGDTMVLR